MQASEIPTKFQIPFANNAGSGYIRNVPQASQIGITNGAASLYDGFPPLNFLPVGSGGTPPWGQDVNGILKQISAWNRWQAAGGPVTYDSTWQVGVGGYPQYATVFSVASPGQQWISLVDNNTTNPDTGGAGWAPYRQAYWADSGSANAYIITPGPACAGYVAGQRWSVLASHSCTGASTINVSGLGTKAITRADLTALQANDILAGQIIDIEYDGTEFQLLTLSPYAWARSNYAVDSSGAANTIIVTLSSPVPLAYTDGQNIVVRVANDVTGATTINANSLGSKSVVRMDGSALQTGDILAGQDALLCYSSALGKFELLNIGINAIQYQTGNYAEDGGSANAYVITISPGFSSYAALTGAPIRIKIRHTNTGASTININSKGVVNIVKSVSNPLMGGELSAGGIVEICYDGVNFQIISFVHYSGDDWVYSGSDTGSVNAIVVDTPTPSLGTTLKVGTVVVVKPSVTNTRSTTLRIGSFSAAPVLYANGSNLLGGEMSSNNASVVTWGGTSWCLVGYNIPSISGAKTFYINNSTGSDGNDGQSTGTAWATIGHAISYLSGVNSNGNSVTLQLALTGITYPSPGYFAAPIPGTLTINGDISNQSSYNISGTGSSLSPVIGMNGSGAIIFSGVTLQNNGSVNHLLAVGLNSVVEIENVTFVTATSNLFSLLYVGPGGNANILSGCIFGGNAGNMWNCSGGRIIMYANCATSSTPTFSNYTVEVGEAGAITLASTSIIWTGSGATGSRYKVSFNGIVIVGGNTSFFPGSSAGTVSTGGQYA